MTTYTVRSGMEDLYDYENEVTYEQMLVAANAANRSEPHPDVWHELYKNGRELGWEDFVYGDYGEIIGIKDE